MSATFAAGKSSQSGSSFAALRDEKTISMVVSCVLIKENM